MRARPERPVQPIMRFAAAKSLESDALKLEAPSNQSAKIDSPDQDVSAKHAGVSLRDPELVHEAEPDIFREKGDLAFGAQRHRARPLLQNAAVLRHMHERPLSHGAAGGVAARDRCRGKESDDFHSFSPIAVGITSKQRQPWPAEYSAFHRPRRR